MPSINDYFRPDLFTYRWRVYGDLALISEGDIEKCMQYWSTGDYPIILLDHLMQQNALRIGRARGRIQFERDKVLAPGSVITLFPTQDISTIEQLRNFLRSLPDRRAEIERRVQEEFRKLQA